MSNKSSARRTLLIMVAVFAVPYALAWYLYQNPELIEGSRNHGTLIKPLITAAEVQFVSRDGASFPAAQGDEKKWMLLMFGGQSCGEDCEKTLFTLQQLRRMMAVDKARLRRAYLLLDGEMNESLGKTLGDYQGTELFLAEADSAPGLAEKLGVATDRLDQHIVIADPMGNLVMLYPREMEPKKIFADIEILFGRVKGV